MKFHFMPEKLQHAYARLRTCGFHASPQRSVVLVSFYACTEAISAEDLWRIAKRGDIGIGYQTVTKILRTMVEAGLALQVKSADGEIRYEHQESRCEHRELVCKDCGAVVIPQPES